MTLIFRLAAAALLHLAFFACYPDTGPYGNYYLAVSLALWAAFLVFINAGTGLVKLLAGPAGGLVGLAVYAVMALALAATMPQADRTTVLEKLRGGKYPDRAVIARGLERFGVNLDKELKRGEKALQKEAAGAVEKAKKELK